MITLVPVSSTYRPGYTHPIGTVVRRIRAVAPGVWLVEIRVPDESLEGGAWYDYADLSDSQMT